VAVYDLVTQAEFKRYLPLSGVKEDQNVQEHISRASRVIEQYLDRRLVYRAPGEDGQNDNIVASANYATGALTVAAQPGSGGRTLILTVDTATAGTVTVTGTVAGVVGTTEVFDVANGRLQHGVKFFTAISGIAVAGASGNGSVKVGSSAGYVEYHTPYSGESELWTLEWPIRQVAEANEDVSLTFGSSTALSASQYQVRRELRKIARVSTGLDFPWYSGRRVVRLTYSAGYFGVANVPDDLKLAACKLAAWSYRESSRQRHGEASGADATGSFVLLGPAMLTTGMKADLDPYLRPDMFDRTGERDWDTEAA
jgi:hypothetical protein